MALEPFACFMDVENSRSYIDELYSEDIYKCQEAIVCLKNAVIGSNKKKGSVISQGIVPRLISLLRDDTKDPSLRLDAAIVIGSLAKGTESQVHSLIYYETVQVLLNIVLNPGTDRRLMETCLGALKTILQYPFAPIELLHCNIGNLVRLIQLASPAGSSIQCQVYVANIFVPLCHSSHQQKNLCQANVIPFLARLMTSQHTILQVPALKCLAAMCFTNKYVSDIVCMTCHEERSILDILTGLLSRTRDVQIQLSASRCLTYLHRSGSLRADDYRIVYKTLPSLARLCSEDFDEDTRATAAETLAYLAEIDSELQRLAAISNHLICSLANLIRCPSPLSRQGAFRCFASLAANDEDIRKRIIEMDGLMEEVLNGLKDTCPEVRLSAVRCLHSLSRSVQLLRTTFQDHSVWRPLMDLLVGEPSLELLTVVTSTICNLLLEFSPAKEPMLDSGAVEMLCELTKHSDPALRLNGSWALMNMAFQAEQKVKSKIIDTLGTDRIFQLLSDSDERVIMKTLGLLRNLLSNTLHIEIIMSEHSSEVLRAVNLVLDGPHPPEVKEQALIIISNITAGARDKDYVMEDENIIKKIREFLVVSDNKLQMGAVFVVRNLMEKGGRQTMLRESGILENLEQLLHMTPRDSQFYEDIRQEILRFDFSDDH